MSRPRQCVPLACVKYVRSQSPLPAVAPVISEVRQSATLVSSLHSSPISGSVPQTSGRSTISTESGGCGSSMSTTATNYVQQSVQSHTLTASENDRSPAASISAAVAATVGPASAQYPTTTMNFVRQSSIPSHTVSAAPPSQRIDVSALMAAAGIGLVSAVWTPRGAITSQPASPKNAGDAVRQQTASCTAEQLDLLGIHRQLTTSFDDEFSRNMNDIISVMHEACKALTSVVFTYTIDQIRRLRSEYCQLTGVCVAYGEYQKNVCGDRCTTLPSVTCMQLSIQIMADSVNKLKAVFRQMHQWLSPNAKLTITERGLGLSNKLCEFVPVFLQQLGNFKRSLLMIMPNAVSIQSTDSSTVTPSTVSSIPSEFESSAAATEAVTNPSLSSCLLPVATQLQELANVELQEQCVEPVFVVPAPIVIQPNGQPDDDKFGLISVKQEPAETNSRRQRTHAEVVYISGGDDGDDFAVNDEECMLSLDDALNVSGAQHYDSTPLIAAQSHRMTGSPAKDITTSSALLCVNSGDILSSLNECIDFDTHDGVSDIQTVMSRVLLSSVMPTVCSVVVTSTSPADRLSSFISVNYTGDGEQAFVGHQQLEVPPTSSAGVCTRMPPDVCLIDSYSDVTCELNDTHGNASDGMNHDIESGGKSATEKGVHTATENNAGYDTLNNRSDVNDMCKITSVCSIELERFDFFDTTESSALDDIVSAVRAFDKNANIAFIKDDLCSLHYSEPSNCDSSLEKTVNRKKKGVLASRFARKKQKPQSSLGSNPSAYSSVSDNTEDVDEANICKEALDSECGKETVDVAAGTDEPVCSDPEHTENKVVGHEDRNVEETLQKTAADVTSQPFEAAQCLESHKENVSGAPQPETEKLPPSPQTDMVENSRADSSSEPLNKSSVSLSVVAEVIISDIDTSHHMNAADLKPDKPASSEKHLAGAVEEKSTKQSESESRDETDSLDGDGDQIHSPAKKKRARVIYEEEDIENQVCSTLTGTLVKDKSMPCKTGIPAEGSDTKKVKKFRSSKHKKCKKLWKLGVKQKTVSVTKTSKAAKNVSIDSINVTADKPVSVESVNHKMSKKGVLVEKQLEKKMKKQEPRKQNCYEKKASVIVDKRAITKVSSANAVPMHKQTANRVQKLKKCKKLWQLGVKQKTVSVTETSKAAKNVSIDSINVNAYKQVCQRRPTSKTVSVGTKEKVPSLSDNSMKAASSASTVHSQGIEDQPILSARDKVNAIFRNSEFTCLHGNTSLVHSRKNKPVSSTGILSPSRLAENQSKDATKMNIISPVKNISVSHVHSKRAGISKSVVTSGYVTAVTTSTVPARSTSKSVASRSGGVSSSVRTSTASKPIAHPHTQVTATAIMAQSHMPVKAKSGQRSHAETSQRTASDATRTFSSFSSLLAVSSSAAYRSHQHPIPSLLSLKLKPPCFPEATTTAAVSSVNHSRTVMLNSSSTSSVRDPRLAHRQQPVCSEQQPTLNKSNKVENSTAGLNDVMTVCSSMQWPQEHADGAGIPMKVSVNSVPEEGTRSEPLLLSRIQNTTSCWMWELGANTQHTTATQSSSLNANVTSFTANQCQSIDSGNVHGRPAVKDGLSGHRVGRLTVNIESQAGMSEAKSSTVRAPSVIMSPTGEHDLQQYVAGDISVPGLHASAAGNTEISDAMESVPHSKDPHWRLIPLDTSGIPHEYNSAKKPLSVRPRWSGDPSDPRLKAASFPVHSASHKDQSDISSPTYQSNDAKCQPVVIRWDTDGVSNDLVSDPCLKSTGLQTSNSSPKDSSDISGAAYQSADLKCRSPVTYRDADLVSDDSASDAQQAELMNELEYLQSEPLLSTDGSLDERISLFSSDMGLFSIDKKVEDHVDKLMSWWETDLDDVPGTHGDDSVHKDDLQQQHLKGHDSDVDDFIVIDDEEDDEDDNSNDGLVIDLDCSGMEIKLEPCYEQSTSDDIRFRTTSPGRTNKHEFATNVEHIRRAETRTKHSLPDKDRQSTPKAKERLRVDDPCNRQEREHRLSTRNDSTITGRHEESAKHRNGSRERMKPSEVCSHGNKRQISSADIFTRKPQKAFALKAPASSNATRRDHERSLNKSRASFHDKSYITARATASNTCSDSASTVAACISCLNDLAEPELGRLKEHMEFCVFEQKISQSGKYACSLGNLSDSEKRNLIDAHLAEPAVLREFSFDLRLQAVLREIRRPSMASKWSNLIVRRDWFYMRLNHLQRYYKSKFVLMLPDDLRLGSERGKFVSVEGVPLILSDSTIPLHHCTRLASVLVLIKSHDGGSPASAVRLPREVRRRLGWLHQERKKLLGEICCSSSQKVTDSIRCLSEKLVVYKYVTFPCVQKSLMLFLKIFMTLAWMLDWVIWIIMVVAVRYC